MNLKIHAVFKSVMGLGAMVLILAGCVERRVVYRDRPDYAQPPPPGIVVEDPAPPPPQYEVVTVSPDPTFIWIGGNWEWRGRWVWGPGRWAPRPHPGATWGRGHWDHRCHSRVWVGGGWR